MRHLKLCVIAFFCCNLLALCGPAVARAETDSRTTEQKVADLAGVIQKLQAQVNAQNQRILELESRGPAAPGAPSGSISQLVKDVELLKRQREVEQEVQLKKDKETPVVVASQDGFGLKSKDGNFQIKFKGLVQTDGRFYADDGTPSASNTFLVRRLRPTLEGTVFKYFDFKLMPDFGGGKTELQDAYVDFRYWKEASLKVGKFKSPMGLERLEGAGNTIFPELSLVSNLLPNRDIGADLHGEVFDGIVSYDIAGFNGSVDNTSNDVDNADDKDLVARVFFLPFKNMAKDWLNGFGAGFAASYGTAHSTTLPAYKTFGQQTFFQYSATTSADGNRYRFAPQFYYYYGPFGMIGEFVQSNQDIQNNTNHSAFRNNAGQLMLSYVLTGENAAYNKNITPRSNFNPAKGTWGAFEVASRIEFFNADKKNLARYADLTRSAERAMGWGLGLNWYLNKNLKFQTAFEQTFFDTGGLVVYGTKNRSNENAFIGRMQVAF